MAQATASTAATAAPAPQYCVVNYDLQHRVLTPDELSLLRRLFSGVRGRPNMERMQELGLPDMGPMMTARQAYARMDAGKQQNIRHYSVHS